MLLDNILSQRWQSEGGRTRIGELETDASLAGELERLRPTTLSLAVDALMPERTHSMRHPAAYVAQLGHCYTDVAGGVGGQHLIRVADCVLSCYRHQLLRGGDLCDLDVDLCAVLHNRWAVPLQ